MKNIISLFLLFIATIAFAQNDEAYVDSMVTQKMAALEMQQNQERFLRKDYCDGNIQMFTMPDGRLCTSTSTYYSVYIFWMENDKVMKMQKFDNCGSYMPLSFQMNKDISKILKEKEALKTQEIKPYKGEKVDDNAFGNMSAQSCHKEYKFALGNDKFEKSFNEFDLTNDSKYKNINAKHNNSIELVALDEEISELIKNLEANGKFFREN